MGDTVLALDIGGTKMAAGVVGAEGQVLSRARTSTPPSPDGDEVYGSLATVAEEALSGQHEGQYPSAIGVGCGGPMRMNEGKVSPLNIIGWRDYPLVANLRRDFNLPVSLDNDAKAFALGEHLFGAGRDHPYMMGVVVSTGVGGGVIIDGKLLHGRSYNGGHVGHIIAEPDGPVCPCGARGCVEAIASGTSLAKLARAELLGGRKSALSIVKPVEQIVAEDVASAAREGDALATELIERAGRALGIGFAGAAALVDIDLVVVGGGVSSVGEMLFDAIRGAIQVYARLDYLRDLMVMPAETGGDAGILGAAALAYANR